MPAWSVFEFAGEDLFIQLATAEELLSDRLRRTL